MKRFRVGIALIIISWLPVAQLLLYIAHANNKLTSEQSSNDFRMIIWGIQICIGLIGVWLAGKVAVDHAKKNGWRHTPKNLWKLMWQGPTAEDPKQ